MEPEEALDLSIELSQVVEAAGRLRRRGSMVFYAPGFKHYEVEGFRNDPWDFPAISVTGPHCALNCEHCGGFILRHMIPAPSPRRLLEACLEVWRRGGRGVLISGGSRLDGSVPLDRFIPVIERVKRELGLTIVVHTGLIKEETVEKLAKANIDTALLDIVGDEETARRVCHVEASLRDYEKSMERLRRHGVPFAPHVLVGLHYGELRGELRALVAIARHGPSALIVIALIPLPGTSMEKLSPPPPSTVARVVAAARLMMPEVPLALGCARPKGLHRVELDRLALRAGVDAVAFPTQAGFDEASKLGLSHSIHPTCCSQVYRDLGGPG
ncbi:MAG: radical SAM protein [Thermoprotei archaeon]|nr:MAG: radical SAM protein [Thermoprotei archaeon]